MHVRLLLECDIEAVVAMAKTNTEQTLPHIKFSADRVRETCRQAIDTASPTMFVVEQDRVPIGFLLATMNSFRMADGLYTAQEVLFVRPDKRGTRAAVLLMKELIRWSIALGASEITGGNDNDFQSDRTMRFLGHFGFEQVGNFVRRRL